MPTSILFYSFCEIEYNHIWQTEFITSIILATTAYFLLRLYIQHRMVIRDILIVSAVVLTFEIVVKIEYLSVLMFLHKCFPYSYFH